MKEQIWAGVISGKKNLSPRVDGARLCRAACVSSVGGTWRVEVGRAAVCEQLAGRAPREMEAAIEEGEPAVVPASLPEAVTRALFELHKVARTQMRPSAARARLV